VALEVERKFLLPEIPEWLAGHPRRQIEQGYLAIAGGTEVRLRKVDGQLYLTVKVGHGEVRDEVEVAIDESQFERLWPLTEALRVRKTRFLVPVGGLSAEVDVFEGHLQGLVTAEIEFPGELQSHAFEPPAWLGEEVTGDGRYANQALARARPGEPA